MNGRNSTPDGGAVGAGGRRPWSPKDPRVAEHQEALEALERDDSITAEALARYERSILPMVQSFREGVPDHMRAPTIAALLNEGLPWDLVQDGMGATTEEMWAAREGAE